MSHCALAIIYTLASLTLTNKTTCIVGRLGIQCSIEHLDTHNCLNEGDTVKILDILTCMPLQPAPVKIEGIPFWGFPIYHVTEKLKPRPTRTMLTNGAATCLMNLLG